MINHHSRFDDFDFEYDKTIIRKLLKHFRLLRSVTKDNPFSCVHIIYLDLIELLREIKLTKKQKKVLNKIIQDVKLSDKEKKICNIIILKLYNVKK